MTHHARFARSFARTVPTPEAIKSLSIGMFRCGSVRFGAVRASGRRVSARATFSSIPKILVTNIRARHPWLLRSLT